MPCFGAASLEWVLLICETITLQNLRFVRVSPARTEYKSAVVNAVGKTYSACKQTQLIMFFITIFMLPVGALLGLILPSKKMVKPRGK